jgi:hypothetical protein
MYSLIMTLLGSKPIAVIHKIECFSGLPVALISACAGVSFPKPLKAKVLRAGFNKKARRFLFILFQLVHRLH